MVSEFAVRVIIPTYNRADLIAQSLSRCRK